MEVEAKGVLSSPSPSFPIPSLGVRSWKSQVRGRGLGGRREKTPRRIEGTPHPHISPPPQRPELGGAGWAHSAGNRVLSSGCRPTGSLATGRKGDQKLSSKNPNTSTQGPAAGVSQDRAPQPVAPRFASRALAMCTWKTAERLALKQFSSHSRFSVAVAAAPSC
jgi:hypothetical protein